MTTITIKNAYPEKPVIAYQKTKIEMGLVIAYIQDLLVSNELKRAAYVFFRIESANGQRGVNNNYAGIQADGARWPEEFDGKIAGTSTTGENGTGKIRRFVCFNSWKDSIDFTIANAGRRGMYVGGKTWRITRLQVKTPTTLCIAYKREWVTGNAKYKPTKDELAGFLSMYRQAEKIFT